MFSGFITTATMCLALLISEVLKAARELKNRFFHESLEKEYGRKLDFTKEIYGESDTKEHTENTTYYFLFLILLDNCTCIIYIFLIPSSIIVYIRSIFTF